MCVYETVPHEVTHQGDWFMKVGAPEITYQKNYVGKACAPEVITSGIRL